MARDDRPAVNLNSRQVDFLNEARVINAMTCLAVYSTKREADRLLAYHWFADALYFHAIELPMLMEHRA
jgi:hypothetical protein